MTTIKSSHDHVYTLPSHGSDTDCAVDTSQRLVYRTSWRDPVTYLPLMTLAVFVLAWVGSLLAEPRPVGDTAPAMLSDPVAGETGSDRTHVYWPSDAGESLPPMP